jgi:hypothetical protein
VGILAAIAWTVLAAAGCGGGSSAGLTARQTVYQKELAYAQCMRAHGLPSFPDPQSDGTFNSTMATRGDFGGPRFQSANKACAHLEGPGMSPVQQQQALSQLLKHAACMRAHGIPGFSDPATGNGNIAIGGLPPGVNPNSPQVQSATRACERFMPGPGGGS